MPPKWEYKIFVLSGTEFTESEDLPKLNKMGQEGWQTAFQFENGDILMAREIPESQ